MKSLSERAIEAWRKREEEDWKIRIERAEKDAEEYKAEFKKAFGLVPEVVIDDGGSCTLMCDGLEFAAIRQYGKASFRLKKTCEECGGPFYLNYSVWTLGQLGLALKDGAGRCDACCFAKPATASSDERFVDLLREMIREEIDGAL